MGTRGTRKKTDRKKLTEHDIQKVLEREYRTCPKYIVENLYIFSWESDFLVKTMSNYWHEVEIKISFSDFKNDAKNKTDKFKILEHGDVERCNMLVKRKRPNYFSYCVTEGIVDKIKPLIPSFAGLYYVDKNKRLVNVRTPKQLHKEKYTDESFKLCEKFYYNYRKWKNHCEESFYQEEINDLRHRISFIKAEFKAATGYDFKEVL